jgi:non-homologous end joining protein Ku
MDNTFEKCLIHLKIMDEYQAITDSGNGDKSILIALRMLKSDIHKAVDKFISMKKKDINDNVLDVIERIIVHAKTLYENEKITDPFDDLTYDRMLSKFKQFRDEPFANNMAGISNAEYVYEKLSGTLDKVHFIYESDRGKHETRTSLEEYIDKIKTHGEELHVMVNQKKDGTSLTCNYV